MNRTDRLRRNFVPWTKKRRNFIFQRQKKEMQAEFNPGNKQGWCRMHVARYAYTHCASKISPMHAMELLTTWRNIIIVTILSWFISHPPHRQTSSFTLSIAVDLSRKITQHWSLILHHFGVLSLYRWRTIFFSILCTTVFWKMLGGKRGKVANGSKLSILCVCITSDILRVGVTKKEGSQINNKSAHLKFRISEGKQCKDFTWLS